MKKLLLMLFCCILSVAAWSQQSRPPRVVSINGTYTSTRTLQPFLGSHNLHALAISGSVTLNSDTSLVRVIMHDVDGKSYLMYEASPMLINGYTDTLTNANEETEWMCGVVPYDLKIVVKDATCTVTGLTATQYSADNHPLRAPAQRDSIRIRQVQAKVDKINAYNLNNNRLWAAGITHGSLLSFEHKRQLFGDESDNEQDELLYYINGLYVNAHHVGSNNTPHYSLTDNFDWRNRHGKNWISPVKNQANAPFCAIFASVGATEALTNMWCNDTINLSLSEEDFVLYNHTGWRPDYVYTHGTNLGAVLSYIRDDGICTEENLPFQDTSNPTKVYETRPEQWPTIGICNYQRCNIDDLQYELINNGPLCVGIKYQERGENNSHVMVLVGYKTIQQGDSVTFYYEKQGVRYKYHAQIGDSMIGQTCLIFKNSWGVYDSRVCDGYVYAVLEPNCLSIAYSLIPPLHGTLYNEEMRNVIDTDGDGYYTWGFKQPKPDFLPDWVPDEQDGDDSDYTKCTMDEYGFLQDLIYSPNDTIFIDTNHTLSELKHLYRPIKVQNHATLTIASNIQGHGDASIVLAEGSHLDISDGTLENISIIGNGASVINIHENSRLNISHSANNVVSLRRTQ